MGGDSALQATDGDVRNGRVSPLNRVTPAPAAVASGHLNAAAVETDTTAPAVHGVKASRESAEVTSSQPTVPCWIDHLPNELLHHIFSHLTTPQQISLQWVSRRWLQAVHGVLARRDQLDLSELDGRENADGLSPFSLTNVQLANAVNLMPSLRHISCYRPTVFHSDESIMDTLVLRCPLLVSLDLPLLRVHHNFQPKQPFCLPYLEVLTPPEFSSFREMDHVLPMLPSLRELRLDQRQAKCFFGQWKRWLEYLLSFDTIPKVGIYFMEPQRVIALQLFFRDEWVTGQ